MMEVRASKKDGWTEMKTKKLAKRNRTSKASRPTRRSERPKTVRVRLVKFGSDVQELRLWPGATVKDLVKARGLHEASIRLNKHAVHLSTQLKDGDLVVAVPPFIVGGSAGRYDHLDLDKYRRTMSPRDFNFFVNFVGAEALGFREEDLEPC